MPLENDGGSYLAPVLINNTLTLKFIIDTGASDVAIPGDVVSTLIRTGTVGKADFIGTGTYVLADGSKLPSSLFIVRELKLGNHVVRNVSASVTPVQGPLLLGQSFLSKLPSWNIDYQKNALIVGDDAGSGRVQQAAPQIAPNPNQGFGQLGTSGDSRWVELKYEDKTIAYDLQTVQMGQPGRFTVLSTTIDQPDVMRFRLKALDTLRSYCKRPDGKYAPPSENFLLGKPDMPIEDIEVRTQNADVPSARFKNVTWSLPYRKMAIGESLENVSFFDCEGPRVESADKEYDEIRSSIIDGISQKELYDCNRGVVGFFFNTNDPLSKVHSFPNIRGAYSEAYMRLCYAITSQMPFAPPNSSK